MLTYKKVNAVLNPLGYEIVQGEGYLYFWTMGENRAPLPMYTSMAVFRLNHTNMVSILEDLADKLDDSRLNTVSDSQSAEFESALVNVRAKIAEFSVDYANEYPVVFLDDICPDCGRRVVCTGQYDETECSTTVKAHNGAGLNKSSSVACYCGRKFQTVNRELWSNMQMRYMKSVQNGEAKFSDAAEIWMLENGHSIPQQDTAEWRTLFSQYVDFAFSDFME